MKPSKTLFKSLIFSFFILGFGNLQGQSSLLNNLTEAQISDIVNGGQIIDVEEAGKIPNPSQGEPQIRLSVNENCNISLTVYVYMANLEGESVPLSDVYVSLLMHPVSFILPLPAMEPLGETHESLIPIHFSTLDLEIDADLFCSPRGEGPSGNFVAKLLHDPGNGQPLQDFPFQQHLDPGDIFECDVFHGTCSEGWCGLPNNCDVNPIHGLEVRGEYEIDCSEGCSEGDSEGGEFGFGSYRSSHIEAVFAPNTPSSIAPNPSTDHAVLTYELTRNSPVVYTVFDATGKVMDHTVNLQTKGIQQKQLDTEAWPKGIYMVQLKAGDQIQNLRLIKM